MFSGCNKRKDNVSGVVFKMKRKSVLEAAMILVLTVLAHAADPAVLVHNTCRDIDAVKGKLKLKLVRVWGGDEEEDEKKFFKSPLDIVINNEGLVYICDSYNHHIKVFERTGKYIRTIGRRGRGPGDLFMPQYLGLSPHGDLVVSELGGRRLQRFNSEGKSKKIIKIKNYIRWVGVTSEDRLVVYAPYNTLETRSLLSIWDDKGKIIKGIGTYHDKVKDYISSDKLYFAMDDSYNIFAVNSKAPVIRKYAPDGKMVMAATFESFFEIQVKIKLNDRGDEIERLEEVDQTSEYRKLKKGKSTMIQRTIKKRREHVCRYIGIDAEKRVYITVFTRILTMDEIKKGPSVGGTAMSFKVRNKENAAAQKIDHISILVFSPAGKVIAEAPLTFYNDGIYVHGNRLFVMDAYINQRILEYEISFKE
jgi:hypothetical protein